MAKNIDHPALETVLPLVMEAASRLRKASLEAVGTESKEGNHQDLVTRWDREIEAWLTTALASAFPGSRFIGEEQSAGAGWEGRSLPAGWVWIIDPIDGTTNFADLGREYSVSLALYVDGLPELALVHDCEREILYSAVAGKGALVNGRPLRIPHAQALDPRHPLRDTIIDISLNSVVYLQSHGADISTLNKEIRGHRAFGCASLGICHVAEGSLGAYISGKLGIWDWAAAHLILTEAGGAGWEGPVRGADKGLRGKSFYMAASSIETGENLIALLGDEDYRNRIRPLEFPHA